MAADPSREFASSAVEGLQARTFDAYACWLASTRIGEPSWDQTEWATEATRGGGGPCHRPKSNLG